MKARVVVFFAAVSVLCLVAWTGYAQKRVSVKSAWEYRVVSTSELGPKYDVSASINELGAQGWELVAVSDNSGGTALFFKRAK